jgi:hypothetical protein
VDSDSSPARQPFLTPESIRRTGPRKWRDVSNYNCRVDLRGKYANGKSADVSNVDICADKTVNLTN